MKRSCSSTDAEISMSFMTRNTSIAACAMRLLPSRKPRFLISEKPSAAAFSMSVE